MKNPSIHISQTTLESIMPEILKCNSVETAVNLVFRLTEGKALSNRVIINELKAPARKKLKKTVSAIEGNISNFQRKLIEYRTLVNHRMVKEIKVTDSSYTSLKEIAGIASEFCKDFKLEENTGYTDFIKRGIKLMGRKYALNKFKYYKDKIYEQYENTLLLKEDADRNNTRKVYSLWKKISEEYSGISQDLCTDDDLVNMLFARQEADDLQAEYEPYLRSQFEGLAFLEVLPSLGALYGVNARSRYRLYEADIGIKGKKEKDKQPIKKLTPEQQRYADLRNRRSED